MFGIDDALLAAGLAAAGSAAGGMMSGHSAAASQEKANKINLQIAREVNQFQERMSNTAFQRGVKDAEAAGLNPYITMTGKPASSPTGTTGAVQMPSNPDYGRGVSSGAQAFSHLLDMKNQVAQNALMQMNTRKVQSDIAVNAASAQQALAQTKSILADVPVKERNRDIELSRFGKVMNYINRVLSPFGSALDAASTGAHIANMAFGIGSSSLGSSRTEFYDREGNITGGVLGHHSSRRKF